ncbi:MAG: type II CAAX endopeptidase family protein [Tissierellia bacterium]|nr:type II CAAX endopeptidase family protein [Tissierellia bacterium]
MNQNIKSIGKGILFFLLWAIGIALVPIPETKIPVFWRLWAEGIPFVITLLITGVFLKFDFYDLRLIPTRNFGKNIGIGVLTGFLWIGLAIVGIYILGGLRLGEKEIVSNLYLWFFALFLNTIMQEVLVRGYIYQSLKYQSKKIAIVFTTLLFTFLHGGAFEAGFIPVLNVVTMSLFMTAVLEYTNSLWPPIIIHYIWNGVGALIYGGVSLAEDYPSLYQMEFLGSPIISGGAVKIEGSIVVLFLNILFLLIFSYLTKKSRNKNRM